MWTVVAIMHDGQWWWIKEAVIRVMKIREPDPVDDHRLPWLTIQLVVAGRQKTSNLALGPILDLVILGSVAVELSPQSASSFGLPGCNWRSRSLWLTLPGKPWRGPDAQLVLPGSSVRSSNWVSTWTLPLLSSVKWHFFSEASSLRTFSTVLHANE